MERRAFIRAAAGAGAGLTLAVMLEGCSEAPPGVDGGFAPNAWVRIGPDGIVVVIVDRSEMGQGVSTALPMLVAEELDADWAMVRYQFAPANEAYYNPMMKVQATGGSTSVRAAWLPLRQAGAVARRMLVAAAAEAWKVGAEACRTEAGYVIHGATGRRSSYGDLAGAAALLPIPTNVPLKRPADFRIIGRPLRRLDLVDKVTGRAVFGLDAGPREALVALIARAPTFGGKLINFDPDPALAVPGVQRVFPAAGGVAVVATTFWAARTGRNALRAIWNEGPAASLNDASISKELDRLLASGGRVATTAGAVGSVNATTLIEAVYEVPYLAHATMEPMNCTADVRPDGVTVWAPTQFQSAPSYMAGGGARGVAARAAGVAIEQVEIHTTHLGGGFGRRSETDFVREAVEVAKSCGAPVRLVWTREDDIRHDHFRPIAKHAIAAGLDAAGRPIVWRHTIASPSIFAKFVPGFIPDWAAHLAGPLKGGIDQSAVEGAADMPYSIPNREFRYAEARFPIPVGYWRSVGHTHTAFAVECMIDELAHAAHQDPVGFRRQLLTDHPRHLAVLDLAAEQAGWGTPAPAGRFRGVAVHESFGSWVAQVAEVSVTGRAVRVHRVVCAVDCGQVVNPDTVKAQMEGGIVYGLTAALKGRITIEAGKVKEGNFHDYPMLRIDEMPVIEVYIVPSQADPGGVGEPGTPPIAPAVANAVFAATGVPVRALPIRVGERP